MANTITLSRAELARIKSSIEEPEITDYEAARRARKKLSDDRVRKWPNTLEAQRRKNENWKKEKLQREEEERQRVDREEAELQKKLRIEAIKRANSILYEQTEKMKNLRSAQMYGDVIADRSEQIKEKSIKGSWHGGLDAEYHKHMVAQIAEAKQREEKEAALRLDKNKQLAKMLKTQVALNKDKYMAHLRQEKHEGELIIKKAKDGLREDAEKVAERSLRARMAAEEMQLENQRLKRIQLELRLKEEEEDEKREKELEQKEKLALRRKEMEATRFAEKQAIRQRMIDRACEELAKQKLNEDDRMHRQAQEARDKQDREMADREEKRRRQREAIDRSRELQVRLKHEKVLQEKEEAAKMVADWKVKAKELEKQDAEERLTILRKNIEIRATHEAQVSEKRQWLEAERQALLNTDAQTKAILSEDESRFQKIAHEVLAQAEAEGKNTVPIRKAMHAKEMELLPATIGLRD